jgi:hypothetical protein
VRRLYISLRTDDFLHTLGHFSLPVSSGTYCAKAGVLLVVNRSAAGNISVAEGVTDGLAAKGIPMDAFRRLQNETGIHPGEMASSSDGRGGAGTVFVLTSSGLRHMGLRPGSARANTTGRGFLGYLQEEIFWKDALELVHEDDVPLLWFLISLVMEEPGASESVDIRFRDAWGDWVLMDVCVLNVLEAPTGNDTGLLVVNVRQPRESTCWRAEMPNGNQQAPR